MKKSVALLCILFTALIGCEDQKNAEQPALEEVHQQHNSERPDPMAWESKIQLDKGQQWKANKATTEGVQNMLLLLKETSTASLENYQKLGDDLAEELNTLISECNMKGPSHDNLHIYLKPLIVHIAQLKEVNSQTEGEKISSEIEAHLQAYRIYFI
ncbi:hypothetical protein GCM10007103_14920 [Salinimicrobium marinum]|uniref:Lipoprotein n=1 Tax=Salinimicrobium marinum TaxID=680283 RepID=A0A918SE56_9FLAO|nr:hypothetical protein [Salinimicrobium marinum]GHA34499.1 hypothetical protein GCM10007103_14920 [Salinimicrobium marinum]